MVILERKKHSKNEQVLELRGLTTNINHDDQASKNTKDIPNKEEWYKILGLTWLKSMTWGQIGMGVHQCKDGQN